MSRTYRRKNTTQNGMWADLEWFTCEWVRHSEFGYASFRKPFPKDSKEYRKGKAKFHSDGGTIDFKEPGPSWYRRMFHKRYKGHVRNELKKFMNDSNYEVDLHDSTEKYVMDYWT